MAHIPWSLSQSNPSNCIIPMIQFLIMADIPMGAKPIKTLELRYPMITFIILYYNNCNVPSYTLFSFIS